MQLKLNLESCSLPNFVTSDMSFEKSQFWLAEKSLQI